MEKRTFGKRHNPTLLGHSAFALGMALLRHLEGCSSPARGFHHLGDNRRLLCEGQSANGRRKALAFLAKCAAKTVV
jgi:hypothetical protein